MKNGECDLNKVGMVSKEWIDEPNILEFESHGFRCFIIRNPILLNLLGYIEIPANHPWHNKELDYLLFPHGGITYDSAFHPSGNATPQYIAPGKNRWIGFDCAHAQDLIPGLTMFRTEIPGFPITYKNIEFVKLELSKMAEVLAGAVSHGSDEC